VISPDFTSTFAIIANFFVINTFIAIAFIVAFIGVDFQNFYLN